MILKIVTCPLATTPICPGSNSNTFWANTECILKNSSDVAASSLLNCVTSIPCKLSYLLPRGVHFSKQNGGIIIIYSAEQSLIYNLHTWTAKSSSVILPLIKGTANSSFTNFVTNDLANVNGKYFMATSKVFVITVLENETDGFEGLWITPIRIFALCF